MTKSTAFVMPTVTLVEEYEPTTELGRKAEDNPFNDVVTALALTYSEELKRSKGAAKLVIPQGETRIRVAAKFQKAARAQGFTARIDDKANESVETGKMVKGQKETVSLGVIAAYLVPLITRTRKSKTVTVTAVPGSLADEANSSEQSEESKEAVNA